MMKRITFATIAVILFSASVANSQGRGRFQRLTFEGTLLSYSPHPKIACGVLFIHQVAKYRVEKVLSGKYVGEEIVVEHPACGGNVFENIPVGSCVRVAVRVWRNYLVTTNHPGIREGRTPPRLWYVAGDPPCSRCPPTKIEGF